MKKYIVVCAGLALAMAVTSCKPSESAYRKMYDAAKANSDVGASAITDGNMGEETVVVAPVTERPITETTVTDNYDNVSVRQENVRVVNGNGLKNFSVVVGSFSVDANADSRRNSRTQVLTRRWHTARQGACTVWLLQHSTTRLTLHAAVTSSVRSIPTRGCSRRRLSNTW